MDLKSDSDDDDDDELPDHDDDDDDDDDDGDDDMTGPIEESSSNLDLTATEDLQPSPGEFHFADTFVTVCSSKMPRGRLLF